MKAILFDKKDPAGSLSLREVPKPVPGERSVLVKLVNTSINAADYRSMAMGIIPKSRIFGADVAGVVEAVGSNTQKFKVGDAVFADLSDAGFGGFAEYVAAPEDAFVLKPDGVPFDQAAALPMASLTALQALRDSGEIRPGKKVLICGAGGGVGTFAVQFARHFGAQVSAVCGSNNTALVRSLGADHVIDYSKEDFTKTGSRFDLVLGINGAYSLLAYRRLLTPAGIFVLVGGALSQIFSTMLFGPFLSIGSKKMRVLAARVDTKDLEFTARLVEEGKIRPVIDRYYPLEQTAEAVNYLRQGHARGKVLITFESAASNPN